MGRRWVAVAAGLLAVVLAVPATGVAAASSPLGGREWWFDAWHLESAVWSRTQGAGVIVGLLDTGVNASLPELAGVVLPGHDATGRGTDGRQDLDPHGHGTAMAALIAAQGTNSGMLGVAPRARILPVRVVGNYQPTDQQTAEAITWAADHGVRVINMAFAERQSCPKPVRDAVRHAVLVRDVVVVAGAGNLNQGGDVSRSPANCPGVLAVGAVGRDGQPWWGSVHQPYVAVAAPGTDAISLDRDGTLSTGSGTSPASALTSAGIALVRAAHPELNARQVVARVLATLRDRPPAGQRDPQRGYGTVRIDHAVNDPVPLDAPNPVYDELGPVTSQQPSHQSVGPGGSAGTDPGGSAVPVWVLVVAAIGVLGVLGIVLVVATRRRR